MALKPKRSEPKAKPGAEAERATAMAATHLIDERIRSLGGWRAEILAEVRRLIHEADPDTMEECKWIKPSNPLGVPVWSHAGIVCTGEAYKQVVKLTFARGASLADPRGLFNSSLDGNARRAIDIREGEVLDAEALKALIRAAVAENLRSSGAFGGSSHGPAAMRTEPEQDSRAALIARIEGRQSPNRQGLDPYTLYEVMQKHLVPGVSVAVIKGFDIHWVKGVGTADVETGRPVVATTLFQAASISKPVTGMLCGPVGRVLSLMSAREMVTPVGMGPYAVGLRVGQRGDGWYFGHAGSNWGFRCRLIGHFRKGYGMAAMTNGEHGIPVLDEIEARVASAYDWDSLAKPVPR